MGVLVFAGKSVVIASPEALNVVLVTVAETAFEQVESSKSVMLDGFDTDPRIVGVRVASGFPPGIEVRLTTGTVVSRTKLVVSA